MLQQRFGVSERLACKVAGQSRSVQRYTPTQKADEDELTQAIVSLASQYGRYGYRRITALLNCQGFEVGKDRVQRIWRREGLKVPKKQRPRRRLWLGDGSCVRLRAQRANHVWSYDFVHHMTHDGRSLRMMTLVDEYSREALAIRVARRRAGDDGQGGQALAARGGCQDLVHRARQSMGERLLRVIQRQAQR